LEKGQSTSRRPDTCSDHIDNGLKDKICSALVEGIREERERVDLFLEYLYKTVKVEAYCLLSFLRPTELSV
jgi:hypothetical protein